MESLMRRTSSVILFISMAGGLQIFGQNPRPNVNERTRAGVMDQSAKTLPHKKYIQDRHGTYLFKPQAAPCSSDPFREEKALSALAGD
jgi:hypothetical protein